MQIIIDGVIYETRSIGGIVRIFNNVLPLLCDLDGTVEVDLILKKIPDFEFPRHNQINTYMPCNHYLLKMSKYYPTLWKKLLVLWKSWSSKDKVWFSTYYTQPPAGWRGLKVVFVHDFIYERYPEQFSQSNLVISQKKQSVLNANRIFCISKTTAKDLQNFYPVNDEKIEITYLGYDDLFRLKKPNEIKQQYPFDFILYVGKREGYKNFNTLLKAYANWKKNEQIKLLVVGGPFTKSEHFAIEKYDLKEKIMNLQNISDDALSDLYNQAVAFIYPSLYEGFGIPLLESMACGCPIIASKIPSTEEVAGIVPIYFSPGDGKSLLSALNKLDNQNLIHEHINLGFQKVKDYSWEKTAKAILDVFQSGMH